VGYRWVTAGFKNWALVCDSLTAAAGRLGSAVTDLCRHVDVIHSYSFTNVTSQNARTYIIYDNVNELYELKKLIGLRTVRIINKLVELHHKHKTEKIKNYIYNG